MTEKLSNQPTLSTADIEQQHHSSFNHVWWIPLIALLTVVYLAVSHFTSQGPLISIRFETAEGMEIKKTKLRYKDVAIGEVEQIDLDSDYKSVLVSVRLDKNSEGLLRQNTRFWVVKPRISVTRVSGLNTLLSGPYIAIDPDKNPDHEYRYDFDALEMPPIVSQDKPGLRLTLLSTKASSLNPGTAVYYKGIQVGSVDRVYFSDDYLWIKADIFIAAPHDLLIKQTTKFWAASGISVNTGAEGLQVDMESVETLLAGGIVFETPVSLQKELNVTDGTEYVLYENKKQAYEQNYGKKHFYVSYFDNSVSGLESGAPVMIQGIKVGKIRDIQLLFDEKNGQTRIPVLFEIYENRLASTQIKHNLPTKNIAKRLIESGFRARLETANLLTGTKYIALTQIDDPNTQPPNVKRDAITGYPVLPTTPQSFDELTAGVSDLIAKLNQLPIEEIASNINHVLLSTDKKINEIDIKKTINDLNKLLTETTVTSKDAKKMLNNLNRTIVKLSKATEKTLAGYSADAPLYYNLNNTLVELNETLASLRALSELLDKKPNALIFGKE